MDKEKGHHARQGHAVVRGLRRQTEEGLKLTALEFSAAFTAVVAVAGALLWLRARRQRQAIAEPFPETWRALLAAKVPLYRRMPVLLRHSLEPHMRTFLKKIRFVGCNGLVVTDEMRIVVALQACLLVSQRDPGAYSPLYSVLLYPDEFVVPDRDEDEAGVVTEGESVLSGQTLDTARIVLSWRDVQASAAADEAYNVVLHEFAHYLDHSVDGAISVAPSRRRALAEWHRVLEREYEALCAAVDRGEATLIDPYGAEELAEFFAVATETFFERPQDFERQHSALYAALSDFYGLDPARW